MSNRKSTSQLRRDWLMICIREIPGGRIINRSGCMRMDDDLRRLIAEGKIILSRVSCPSVFRSIRRTMVSAKDGLPNSPGFIICPACKRSAEHSSFVIHKIGCAVARNNVRGEQSEKGPKTLCATHTD